MREGLVRFSHAVYIFFLLDGGAFTVGGVEQFVGELVFHSLFGAAAAIRQQPADGERGATVGIHFDRNLIVRATDAAGLDFEQRLGILDGLLEQLDSLVAALFLHLLHGVVEDALGGGLLAAPHHRVHELGDQGGVVDGISCYFTLRYVAFSRHYFFCSGAKPQTFLRLRALGSVLGARLLAVGDAGGVERAAHNVITDTRQVFHAAAADEHDGVLLQVVADAGDVSGDFNAVGEANARDFAQRRVRLLGGLRVDAGTDTTLLRTFLQGGRGRLVVRRGPSLFHQLIECWHS